MTTHPKQSEKRTLKIAITEVLDSLFVNQTRLPMKSLKERLAGRKAILQNAKAGAAALGSIAAIASQAEAVVFTTIPLTESTAWAWSFNPLTGNYDNNYTSTDNLLYIYSCGGTEFNEFAGDNANIQRAGDYYDDILLTAGSTLGPSSSFIDTVDTTHYAYDYGTTAAETVYYFGFRLLNQGLGGDETYYGWLSFKYDGSSVGYDNLRLLEIAVGDNGQAVTVGTMPVPEPATTVFAIGGIALAGAVITRNRKKKTAA